MHVYLAWCEVMIEAQNYLNGDDNITYGVEKASIIDKYNVCKI
jgi:hypothetical protein